QKVWPGAVSGTDQATNPEPVRFTSPLFFPRKEADKGDDGKGDDGDGKGDGKGDGEGGDNELKNYDRVAFETDLPALEAACNPFTGAGCSNPPAGANFYPIYTTGGEEDRCVWQLGGAHIPGTTNTFGGTSTSEYGPLLKLVYPTPAGGQFFISDYRRILDEN